jgi:hypothetical protein
MPHINYRRGESRTFVVRKNNWSTRGRRKSGMGKRYQVHLGFGIRNWCPCCQPGNPSDRFWKRLANRIDRIAGKKACEEGFREYTDGYEDDPIDGP